MKKPKRGVAMLAALLFLVVASGIITLLFMSTLSEIRHSGDDIAIVQALTLARGGANMGGKILQDAVRDELQILTINGANTVERFPFGTAPEISDPEPTADSVIRDLNEKVLADLQLRVNALLCSEEISPVNAYKVTVKVYVTGAACDEPLPANITLPAARYISGQTRTYAIPFVLVAEAEVGSGYKRSIASQGEYQFTLGGGKFSQYAHFTDQKRENLWFTSETIYDGRVHTNQTFNLAYKPWFGAKVTSVGCDTVVASTGVDGRPTTKCALYNPGATFRSNGFKGVEEIGDPPAFGSHQPQFTQGVDWEAGYVPLPEDNLDLDDQAKGLNASDPSKGLYVDSSLYSLELYAGDADGNPLSRDADGNWLPLATHQYIELCETVSSCRLYRYSDDKKLYKRAADGTWPDLPELLVEEEFNGLIYVAGSVARFEGPDRLSPVPPALASSDDAPPALAAFATLTVVPRDTLRITGDLTYEVPPCAGVLSRDADGSVTRPLCDNLNIKNILGVFSPEGDIVVGHKNDDTALNAPDDLTIHGSYMAAKGTFVTENISSPRVARGSINILGGIIQEIEGTTGLSNGGRVVEGYGLNITFDQRMALDYSPPFFPGTGLSDVQGVFIYSFGQREQVF